MGCCKQYCALLKKNVLIKKRAWGSTLFELILPAIVFLVLVIVKELLPPKPFDASFNLNRAIPVNQTLGFAQLNNFMADDNLMFGFIGPIADTQPIADYMLRTGMDSSSFKMFTTEDEFKDYVQGSGYGMSDDYRGLYAAVQIEDLQGPNYSYKLRFNESDSQIPSTKLSAWNFYDKTLDMEAPLMYSLKGFVLLQSIIDAYILEKENVYNFIDGPLNATIFDSSIEQLLQPMPTQSYVDDIFVTIAGESLGFILTLVFIWPLTRIMSSLVEEKETKMKALLKLMGASSAAIVFSWWTLYCVMFAIISVLICLCSFWGLYSNSVIVYIFFVYFFFGLSVFSLGFFMSAFFDNAKTAATFGAIIFLCTFFVSFGVGDSTNMGAKIIVSIIPTIALAFTGQTLAELEGLEVGATAQSVKDEISAYSVNAGIGMLIFDTVFFMLLGLYFNQVVKSEYTISKPWYFVCTPKFWFGTSADRQSSLLGCCCRETKPDVQLSPIDYNTANEGAETKMQHIQRQPNDKPMMQIRDLRRTFKSEHNSCCKKNPDFVAVKGLTMDVYEGEVVGILGENGAGKSTSLNMAMGLLPHTSGEALLNGYSLTHDIQKIYKQQGVCFQHDVLYPTLTVYEHMRLFAAIKGWEGNDEELDKHIHKLLDNVGLGLKGDNKIDSYPPQCSGGQRRKLSLALALLCDSKIIYLDEPSTGVDVSSARTIWDTIIANRKGRIFIITTHSMEEAASISDYIGIFAAGALVCYGSVLYLKQQYGVGYSLTINKKVAENQADDVLDDDGDDDDEETGAGLNTPASPSRDIVPHEGNNIDQSNAFKSNGGGDQQNVSTKSGALINNYITTTYPFCTLSNDTAGEIAFKLPLDQAPLLPSLLDDLEVKQNNLGIASFGLGVTSLVEVFLQAIRGHSREDLYEKELQRQYYEQQLKKQQQHGNNSGDLEMQQMMNSDGTMVTNGKKRGKKGKNKAIDDTWGQTANRIDELSDISIFWRHFWALFVKRWHWSRRDGKAITWQLLYPGIILLAGLLAMKYAVTKQLPERDVMGTLYPIGSHLPITGTRDTTVTPSIIIPTIDNIITNGFGDVVEPLFRHEFITPLINNPDDEINNLLDMQRWLNDTFYDRKFKTPRFGAYFIESIENIPVQDTSISSKLKLSIHYNTTAQDSIPVYTNMLNNALLATSPITSDATIQTTNYPLPRTKRELTFISASVAFIIAIAMSFVPASFAAYIVRERTDKIKHLQQVSGVSNIAYWTSTMAWDIVNFILPFLLFIIILFSFDLEPIMEPTGIIITIVGLWLYVLASLPFTYCLTFLFESHTTAQNMVLLINFLGSVVLLILSVMLTIIKSSREANKVLRFFYRLIPPYCLGDLFAMVLIRENVFPESQSAWELHVAGWDLIFLVIDFILYSLLLIWLEHMSSNNTLEWLKGGCGSVKMDDENDESSLSYDPEEDSDVKDMRERIQRGEYDNFEEYPVVAKGLRKLYPGKPKPFIAATNVYFKLKLGQCIAYLGANGAGKSTVMKMLTSDTYPSAGSGDAIVAGYSLLNDSQKIRRHLGYVPQFDALLGLLTPTEHLKMYAAIKCLPEDKIDGYVNYLLEKGGLAHLAHRPTGQLSGGNRRKVSLLLAMIGNPKVLICDEISSGVDPNSQRILHNLISGTMKNRCVILVSHHLSEAEALAQNISIMASGRVRCYGSSLHLKTKFGHGYQVELECTPGETDKAKQWFETTFNQGFKIMEEFRTTLRYSIPRDIYKMSNVFRLLEDAKSSQKYGIEAYSCALISLDQIFIDFIKQDDARREKNQGLRT